MGVPIAAVCSTNEGKVVYAQAYIALVLNVCELFCCKNALRGERDGALAVVVGAVQCDVSRGRRAVESRW